MTFWDFLSYILSFFHELFYIGLFSVTLPDGTLADINIGMVLVFSILITVFIHLLIPSTRGI